MRRYSTAFGLMTDYIGCKTRWWVIVPVCFLLGWGGAELDDDFVSSVSSLVADTYINKFNAMSGANISEYLYYVVSDDAAPLHQIANAGSGINRIDETDLPRVFHAYIAAGARREMLGSLRELPAVSAVFTVPFMCH